MNHNPWNDDDSWWHQQDLEAQEREEAERRERFDRAMAELNAVVEEELRKINGRLH